MSLSGNFSLYSSQRLGCSIKLWQFTLKNTNILFSEIVDVIVSDCFGQKPIYFRNIKLKAGQSVAFNFDTVDWEWYQDDFAAVIDSNNKILKKWQFHINEYKPGECPECHGTHKCSHCQGHGMIYPPGKIWELRTCNYCGGTGICLTCDITRRKPILGFGPTGLKPF